MKILSWDDDDNMAAECLDSEIDAFHLELCLMDRIPTDTVLMDLERERLRRYGNIIRCENVFWRFFNVFKNRISFRICGFL